MPAEKTTQAETRFWSRVQKTESCWLWTGGMFVQGYGLASINGKTVQAHRVSYELLIGVIPEGKVLHHVCEVKRCVNPAHLQVMTQGEHLSLYRHRLHHPGPRKMCFKNLHPMIPDNVYVNPKGDRICRECKRQNQRRWLKEGALPGRERLDLRR